MMADDPTGNIADDYALAYYPTIYKICPDRMVTEVGQLSSVSAYMNEVNSCSQATFSKDMKMVSILGMQLIVAEHYKTLLFKFKTTAWDQQLIVLMF